MTLSDVEARVSFLTGTTTTEYTAANRLISENKALFETESLILEHMDGWDFDDKNHDDFAEMKADLVANQADYSLPITTLKVKRGEITFDGTNWSRMTPFDINEDSNATDSTTKAQDFFKTKPLYDLQDNSVIIYPTPDANVTKGLKLWVSRLGDAITSSEVTTGTKVIGFDTQFHDLIPLKMALDYFITKDMERAGNIKAQITELEQRMIRFYGKKDDDTNLAMQGAYVDYN